MSSGARRDVLPLEPAVIDGLGGLDPLLDFWSSLRDVVATFSPERTPEKRAENRARLAAIKAPRDPAEMVEHILPQQDYPRLWKDEHRVEMNPIEVCCDFIDYPSSRVRLLQVCDAVLARLHASRPKAEAAAGDAAAAPKSEADGVRTDAAVSPPEQSIAGQQSIAPSPETAKTMEDRVQDAIVHLMRDVKNGRAPKSERAYARMVGIRHSSTLNRDKAWRAARRGATKGTSDPGDLKSVKAEDGHFEVWKEEEVCENCLTESKGVVRRQHHGEVIRVCEACAKKLGCNA